MIDKTQKTVWYADLCLNEFSIHDLTPSWKILHGPQHCKNIKAISKGYIVVHENFIRIETQEGTNIKSIQNIAISMEAGKAIAELLK